MCFWPVLGALFVYDFLTGRNKIEFGPPVETPTKIVVRVAPSNTLFTFRQQPYQDEQKLPEPEKIDLYVSRILEEYRKKEFERICAQYQEVYI